MIPHELYFAGFGKGARHAAGLVRAIERDFDNFDRRGAESQLSGAAAIDLNGDIWARSCRRQLHEQTSAYAI